MPRTGCLGAIHGVEATASYSHEALNCNIFQNNMLRLKPERG